MRKKTGIPVNLAVLGSEEPNGRVIIGRVYGKGKDKVIEIIAASGERSASMVLGLKEWARLKELVEGKPKKGKKEKR